MFSNLPDTCLWILLGCPRTWKDLFSITRRNPVKKKKKIGWRMMKLSERIYFPFIPLVFFSLLEGWGVKHPGKSERRRGCGLELFPAQSWQSTAAAGRKKLADWSWGKRQEGGVVQEPSFARSPLTLCPLHACSQAKVELFCYLFVYLFIFARDPAWERKAGQGG